MINEMKDEVVATEKVKVGSEYRIKQATSFEVLKTTAREWRPVAIKDIEPNGSPIFDIPIGYETVSPILLWNEHAKDTLQSVRNNANAFGMAGMGDMIQFTDICRLCGHPIKEQWFIQNDSKKLLIMVGSSCVNQFWGAGYVEKEIKIFKENKIRKEFAEWKQTAIERLSKQIEGRCGHHATYQQNCYYCNRLVYWAWKLKSKIEKTVAEKTTSRKLENLILKTESSFKKGVEKNGE